MKSRNLLQDFFKLESSYFLPGLKHCPSLSQGVALRITLIHPLFCETDLGLEERRTEEARILKKAETQVTGKQDQGLNLKI